MRNYQLCKNGIRNCGCQSTTGGARHDFMYIWCQQYHGIKNEWEKAALEIK